MSRYDHKIETSLEGIDAQEPKLRDAEGKREPGRYQRLDLFTPGDLPNDVRLYDLLMKTG